LRSHRKPTADRVIAAGEEKAVATGKEPGGTPNRPPVEGPLPTNQVNPTGEESRITPWRPMSCTSPTTSGRDREAHHPLLSERFAGAPPQPKDPTPVEAMA
jgi:hypothetical protein